LEQGERATFDEQFLRELQVQSGLRQGPDALEGRAAFAEKRKARFIGQ
ncbi:MAG: crotonase, partial [Gemmatimonadales bacterium]|nr:crotonase [Gemmatimonadales bacterium]